MATTNLINEDTHKNNPNFSAPSISVGPTHQDASPLLSSYTLLPNLNQPQCEYPPFPGLMYPHPSTSHHLAYPILLKFATDGCPVDCGPAWSSQQLHKAIQRGNHPLACTPEAIICLCKEMLEKVKQGFAKIIPWSKLEKSHHPNLKISPLAAIPHKSRPFCAILDLSYTPIIDGQPLSSVNALTKPCSHPASMKQLGQVLPRIIYNVATAPIDSSPIYMAKWDLKDGFW